MTPPNEDPKAAFEDEAKKLIGQMPDTLLLKLTIEIVMKEISCAIKHFQQVMACPLIKPEKLEAVAESLAGAIIVLRDSLADSSEPFEEREIAVEELKKLLLVKVPCPKI